MKRSQQRRRSSSRFFVTALVLAVFIFAVVKVTESWLHRSRGPTSRAPSASATAAIAETTDSLHGFQVFLKRGGCNGGCPYYALMYKDGRLKYVGVRGVKKQGTVTEPLSRYEQRELLSAVEKAAFFALGDSYDLRSPGCDAVRTDAPTYTVGVTLNAQTKIVATNEACRNVPPQLRQLARNIDAVTHSAQWTGAVHAHGAATVAPKGGGAAPAGRR